MSVCRSSLVAATETGIVRAERGKLSILQEIAAASSSRKAMNTTFNSLLSTALVLAWSQTFQTLHRQAGYESGFPDSARMWSRTVPFQLLHHAQKLFRGVKRIGPLRSPAGNPERGRKILL
jgi:hypothetical protein